MSYVAASAAVVGIGMQAYGSMKAGQAAGRAASAQGAAADAWLADIHQKEQSALDKIQTPQQLAAYDKALQSQERNVGRMESLAASLDPALVEAGKQTTALLQGKSAPVLGQIQAQRDLQRKQMLDNLRTQLGPGAETSSAGIQAIQQFDMQTANMMNEVQQQYLGQVSNLALGGGQTLGDTLNKVNATLTDIQKNSPGAQAADLMARFTAAENGAQEAKVGAAGGQYAQDQIQGQTISNIGNTATTLGALYAGKQYFQNPTAPGAPTPAGAAPGPAAAPGSAVGAAGGLSMNDGAGYGSMSNGNLSGAVLPPVARSAGVGIPSRQQDLGAVGTFGGGIGYGGAPAAMGSYLPPRYAPVDASSFGANLFRLNNTSNIAGGD